MQLSQNDSGVRNIGSSKIKPLFFICYFHSSAHIKLYAQYISKTANNVCVVIVWHFFIGYYAMAIVKVSVVIICCPDSNNILMARMRKRKCCKRFSNLLRLIFYQPQANTHTTTLRVHTNKETLSG